MPSTESLLIAKQQLIDRISLEISAGIPAFNRTDAVTDLKQTPFLIAMKTKGYQVKMNHSGCQILETCPFCKGSWRHTFNKNAQEIKLCSDCGK